MVIFTARNIAGFSFKLAEEIEEMLVEMEELMVIRDRDKIAIQA